MFTVVSHHLQLTHLCHSASHYFQVSHLHHLLSNSLVIN